MIEIFAANTADTAKDNSGLIGAAIGAIVTIIIAAFGAMYKFGKISGRLDGVETAIKATTSGLNQLRIDMNKRIDEVLLSGISPRGGGGLTIAESPRQLTEQGRKVAEESGVKELVESKYDDILKEVKSRKPKNAYQVEQYVISAVRHLTEDSEIKNNLEEGSFKSGFPLSVVLIVGGLHIRDKVLQALEMDPKDIDKHDPEKKNE